MAEPNYKYIMEIFGKHISIRDYVCSTTGGSSCANNKVNLYIYSSGYCPARCSFCPGFTSKDRIDINKFRISLIELHQKQVINRISLTGGEPLSDLNAVESILHTITDVCGADTYPVSINTNGMNLQSLRTIPHFYVLNDIHISRHSYNDIENNVIFGIKTPSITYLAKEFKMGPKIFSLSCNLMKGFIDSPEKLRGYLDFAIQVGAYQVGFVSLMNKTQSCDNLFIDYEDITSKLYVRDGFLFEKFAKDRESCKCENFTYYNELGEVPFYLRRVLVGSADYVKAFIFNQDNNLITNFGKDMVLL